MATANKRKRGWKRPPRGAWDAQSVEALIDELWSLRRAMVERATRLERTLRRVDPAHRPSAINLTHYLAMRGIDLRGLQQRLAWVGVSSLGRAETHVLANVDKVLGILHRIAGRPWTSLANDEPTGFVRGSALLAQLAAALFGASPRERAVRIMVTLPSEAARDDALVEGLLRSGMDVARINCAHDSAAEWVAMVERVRRLSLQLKRPVRVLMDLAGPKLRTGAVRDAPAVLKLKPARDAFGRVIARARLGLVPSGSPLTLAGASCCVGVDAKWLGRLQIGDHIGLTDTRGARRRLKVIDCDSAGVLVEGDHTAYLSRETCLQVHRDGGKVRKSLITDLPAQPGQLHLRRGEILKVVRHGWGRDAMPASAGRSATPATIACTLPEIFGSVRAGERIWFDDGRVGGVVRRADAKHIEVEITEARDGGEHLAGDKGINLPDTRLDLAALTPKDLKDLKVAVRHADIVGLSFAQSGEDVRTLRRHLVKLGGGHLALMLKVETKRGFEHLPELLLAAMEAPAAGVMIARGDLAVECGYERMAELQEEILWACEAAHVPVVWATQVLETLAKTGIPSRAEITDAAMAGRAECVMLNKGPHILDAMRTLNDILQRMQAHQSKKRPLLRALRGWDLSADAVDRTSGPKRTAKARAAPAAQTASETVRILTQSVRRRVHTPVDGVSPPRQRNPKQKSLAG
jgi:pyruvate kinase